MIIRHTPSAILHDPDLFFRRGRLVDHPESVARYEVLLAAATSLGALAEPADHGIEPILAAHDPLYIDLL